MTDTQTDQPSDTFLVPAALEAELTDLAARYDAAGGLGLQVLNMLGTQAEGLLDGLPEGVQSTLEEATQRALKIAMKAARHSREVTGGSAHWLDRTVAAATGAAGGFGGLPSALMELPVTTTLLLRAIQSVAIDEGFDPAKPDIQKECLVVLAADGPLEAEHSAGTDLSFVTARAAVSGAAVQAVIGRVVPRLATALGQKLAAQAVPVLGAVAGAATNYAYIGYYQEIARVHFRLLRLAQDNNIVAGYLAADLRIRLKEKADRKRKLRSGRL